MTLHAAGFARPRVSPPGRCARTAPFHPYLIPTLKEVRAIGGIFSVALSLARDRGGTALRAVSLNSLLGEQCHQSPGRVGVTHRRTLPCSDFPQTGETHPARGRLAAP